MENFMAINSGIPGESNNALIETLEYGSINMTIILALIYLTTHSFALSSEKFTCALI